MRRPNRYLFVAALPIVALLASGFVSSIRGVNPEEFEATYRANIDSYKKAVHLDLVDYEILFVPNEIRFIKMAKRNTVSATEEEAFYEAHENHYEFLLQLSNPKYTGEFIQIPYDDQTSYEQRLSYYSFEMEKDLKFVVDEKDTLSITDYTFERNFGASPKVSILIGLHYPKKFTQIELLVDNQMIPHNTVGFSFLSSDLHALPTLKKYKQWKN